jgi:formamidopyrimidine-DNA glycosylase
VPELPDILLYIHALEPRVVGRRIDAIELGSPFLLRSVEPRLDRAIGRTVEGLRRLGKRIAFELEGGLFLVFHLMIAGRFKWREEKPATDRKRGARPSALLTIHFAHGTLTLTEAGTVHRASLHVVDGAVALAAHDPGGLEVLDSDAAAYDSALKQANHTLKRSLTDPRVFSGIGNAYSDEILHAARLSPLKLSRSLTDEEFTRLYDATRATLTRWTDRLRAQTGEGFPEKVTAFHDEMAVHGRFKRPCPVCGKPVQRIVYASNECNYCAVCQTGGRLLADRSLSRLLKSDWPRSIDEL